MNRDDENWFDALAGKPNPSTDSSTLQEASALRTAIMSTNEYPQQKKATVVNIQALQNLKERLRSEGLLDQKSRTSNSRLTIAASLAASIVVCVSVSMSVLNSSDMPSLESNTAFRGNLDSAIVNTENPEFTANQFKQALGKLDIKAQVQCVDLICTIEAFIPSDREDEVNALLKNWGKTIRTNGHLFLTFQTQIKQ